MDAKGRLAVPTKHREELLKQSPEGLVLTAHLDSCLLLYPKAVWEPIQERIMSLPSFDKKIAALQRRLVGHAEDVALDNAGRILVSSALREFAGLEKPVKFIGLGSHFELWDASTLRKQDEDVDFSEMPEEVRGISLT